MGGNQIYSSETNIRSAVSSDGRTYTKSAREKFLKGSLDDVSKNPFGGDDFAQPQESSLRRCRSLAISREDIFTNLDVRGPRQNHRRSQLIPRAKLIGRSSVKDSRSASRQQQNNSSGEDQLNDSPTKPQKKKSTASSSEYIAIPGSRKQSVQDRHQQQQQSLNANADDNEEEDRRAHLSPSFNNNSNNNNNNSDSSDLGASYFRHDDLVGSGGSAFVQVGGSGGNNNFLASLNCSEIDSLDCHQQSQPLPTTAVQAQHHQQQNPYQELGLSLPNYYPDPKYDTDVSIQDNLSFNEEEPSPLFDGKPSSLPNFSSISIDYDSEDYDTSYYEPIKKLSYPHHEQYGNQNRDEVDSPNIIYSSNNNLGSKNKTTNNKANRFDEDASSNHYYSSGQTDKINNDLEDVNESPLSTPVEQRKHTQQHRQVDDNFQLKFPEILPSNHNRGHAQHNNRSNATSARANSSLSSSNSCSSPSSPSSVVKEYKQNKKNKDKSVVNPPGDSCGAAESATSKQRLGKAHSVDSSRYPSSACKSIRGKSCAGASISDNADNGRKDKGGGAPTVRSVTKKNGTHLPDGDYKLSSNSEVYYSSGIGKEAKSANNKEINNNSSGGKSHQQQKSSKEDKKHNALREFLETQKSNAAKPLQNFLSKTILSRAFGGNGENNLKRNDKLTSSLRTESSLLDNQYHSLPDITISKNLRKCEKIDRKLRKCEKNSTSSAAIPAPSSTSGGGPQNKQNQTNNPSADNTNSNSKNRFIVNIGPHFDVALPDNNRNPIANVDFEVKITKIQPKQHKISEIKSASGEYFTENGNHHRKIDLRDVKDASKKDLTFLEAVKNLKETLNGSVYSSGPVVSTTPTEEISGVVKQKLQRQDSYDSYKQQKVGQLLDKKSTNKLPKIKEEVTREISSDQDDFEEEEDVEIIYISANSQRVVRKGAEDMDSRKHRCVEPHDSNDGNENVSEEIRGKLGNMRNYWDKMIYGETEAAERKKSANENNEQDASNSETKKSGSCKIVDVQTKVEDVIKKFEPSSPQEGSQQENTSPNIVQMTKQMFELKSTKANGIQPELGVRDSCSFFHNPYFESKRFHDDSNHAFESLSPHVVELIEKEDAATSQSNKEAGEKLIVSDNKIEKRKATRKLCTDSKTHEKHKPLTKSQSSFATDDAEFDHVRYRVIKSDLFQKSIFANCNKEKQFDGLMQYLQDYSFQELLIDNNVVIIEPIRTKIQYQESPKATRNVTQYTHKPVNATVTNKQTGLKHHFFYHPIRVNREVNDDELPNPDTVKQVREFFEGGLTKSLSTNGLDELKTAKSHIQYQAYDPDKDRCSEPDSSYSPLSGYCSDENLYETLNEDFCCARQYVSEEILKKIRECGTSVTYYGGKVLKRGTGVEISPMTRAIMEEIKGQQRNKDCGCKKGDKREGNVRNRCRIVEDKILVKNGDSNKDTYQGIKFKLVKSNSCSSRLELVGTENYADYKQFFSTDKQHKSAVNERNLKNQMRNSRIVEVIPENDSYIQEADDCVRTGDSMEYASAKDNKELLSTSESNKDCFSNCTPPAAKVIAEEKKAKLTTISESRQQQEHAAEKKMTQWGEIKDEKTYANITFSRSNNVAPKINYDYRGYDVNNVRKPKLKEEMEFESYEIAGNCSRNDGNESYNGWSIIYLFQSTKELLVDFLFGALARIGNLPFLLQRLLIRNKDTKSIAPERDFEKNDPTSELD